MFAAMVPLEKPKIRVVVADDQALFRQGLVALFKASTEFEVVAEAHNGQEAIDQVATHSPDVLLLDIQMPVIDGILAARRIRDLQLRTEIVFLSSAYSEDQVREAFEAGGRGYLLKGCDFEELSYALRKASNGDFYLSGPAGSDVVAEYVKPALNVLKPGGIVTKRERELARLLADGYSTKEAADILNISPKTAETHRASIMKKLNAKNVTDIVKYCIRNHIIEP
ncbi:MAG: response regulator transcription factor [Candidatus Zixiibacteriota bacterium]